MMVILVLSLNSDVHSTATPEKWGKVLFWVFSRNRNIFPGTISCEIKPLPGKRLFRETFATLLPSDVRISI
jgi:hypothetical protein